MKRLKCIAILLALALALVALSAMFGALGRVVAAPAAIGPRPLAPCLSHISMEDQDETGWFLLVDVSDNKNYPHYSTNVIILKEIAYTGLLTAATHWDVSFGIIGEVGDSNTYVEFFYTTCRNKIAQFDEKWVVPEHGLSMRVLSDDTLQFVASMEYTSTTAITTTTIMSSPVTLSDVISPVAGIGDLVMLVHEREAGGYLEHLSVGIFYGTE